MLLARMCAVGRSFWQDCVLLVVVCCSRHKSVLVLEEVCVFELRIIGWSVCYSLQEC